MENINIIEEITILNIAVGKKMFNLTKNQTVNKSPSPLQFKILRFLLENKNQKICQKTLEKNLNVSKATISGALLTMEKNGIISRNTSGIDAREKNIELTELSINRFKEMKEINEKINRELLKNISEEDLNVFLSVLEKMKKNIYEIEDGDEKK